jgi:hypothetical protein
LACRNAPRLASGLNCPASCVREQQQRDYSDRRHASRNLHHSDHRFFGISVPQHAGNPECELAFCSASRFTEPLVCRRLFSCTYLSGHAHFPHAFPLRNAASYRWALPPTIDCRNIDL